RPDGSSLLCRAGSGREWWTFAGTRANATLAGELTRLCGGRADFDALVITVEGAEGGLTIERAVRELGSHDPSPMAPSIDAAALEGLKFCECLPEELALETLASRLRDISAVRALLSQPVRVVSGR